MSRKRINDEHEEEHNDEYDFEYGEDLPDSDDEDFETAVHVLKIGVVGYSVTNFDNNEARNALENILDEIEEDYVINGDYGSIVIVSSGTALGISKIAYEVAGDRGYGTIAVVPEQAKSYELYDVDEIIWVGEKFGDESEKFINSIDVMVKIGSNDQSNDEARMAEENNIPVYDFDM